MKEIYENALEKVCEELKSDKSIAGIILYGSLAKGNNHKYSDIDLYVVKEDEKDKTTFFFEDTVPIQISWRSVESFKSKFNKRTRGVPMGLVGKILYDPSGLIGEYMEKSRLKADEGPAALSEQEKLIIRSILSQDLKTVEGLIENGKLAGAVTLITEILFEALSGYYDVRKWYMPTNKHLIEDLKLREKEIGELAEQVMLCPSVSEKLDKLSKIKDIVLNEMGGEVKEYEIFW
ncbi:nucleotidyltransferase domain-containing protein [Tissierella sp. MSJ-40]|uniref:Nucleotidyltransferase domain-containing protein n=1 Tax=Tissierella simiarum TaxID=2841534 RepID=A0ABS6E9Y2_9FIRM|nr:nucleotidyltransferase domain-containing protein [Tissierella simiarum]MBU5439210.1 nucleotidyltransferase domain-containing protein [Tissierella simiarum]